jgi:hypothetical protein
MTPFDILLTLIGSAAGWAIFAGSLTVAREMDLRNGRLLTGAAWGATALSGAWLGAVPGFMQQAPVWEVVMLACTLAVVLWTNIGRIVEQAKRPAVVRGLVPLVASGLLASCVAAAPALGFEMVGKTLTFSDEEIRQCHQEGGCHVFSTKALLEMRKAAQAECMAPNRT